MMMTACTWGMATAVPTTGGDETRNVDDKRKVGRCPTAAAAPPPRRHPRPGRFHSRTKSNSNSVVCNWAVRTGSSVAVHVGEAVSREIGSGPAHESRV